MIYLGKRGELRIQSGVVTASSNHYFSIGFVNMDFSGPLGRARPDETPMLDRGNLTSTAHYVPGPDDAIMAPVNVTFTATLDDAVNRTDLYDALGNPASNTPWTVGGLSFANTNGTSQILNGSNVLVSTPAPFDAAHDRVDVAVLWRGDNPGTNDEGWAYREVWFSPQNIQITESDNGVRMAATGWCYGAVSHITQFSAGSAV